jgi:hypothetical protein
VTLNDENGSLKCLEFAVFFPEREQKMAFLKVLAILY